MTRVVMISLAVTGLLLFTSTSARADKVDRLVSELTSSRDYKVRLSAALSLSKIGDSRALPAFVKALRDSDKTVRGVAAASLGKLVTSATSAKAKRRVLAALKRSAAKDDNAFVRKQAQKAYDTLAQLRGPSSAAAGGTFVDIGSMSAETRDADAMRSLMSRITETTFRKKAAAMMTSWPSGGGPSKKQLRAKGITAFHVDGTLNELSTEKVGNSTLVSCKVSMLLATYPEKSMFGFLKGGAQVQAGTSARDVKLAQQDCVAAVIEDLIARKIIPTIEARTK